MKLKRLKIKELEPSLRMSMKDMLKYMGGYAYDDASCFFNCLEYISKEICGNDYNCDYYGNAYFQGNGSYVGTGNIDDYRNGPSAYDEDGNINQKTYEFFSHFFATEGSGWTTGSDISGLLSGGSEGGAVLGFFQVDGSTAHCVILQGYDEATGTYTYFDPSKEGSDSAKTGTVSGSHMLFAGKGGCK